MYAADPYAAALAASPAAAAAAYGVGAMVSLVSVCVSRSQILRRFLTKPLSRRPLSTEEDTAGSRHINTLPDLLSLWTPPTAADLGGKNPITLLDTQKKKAKRVCYERTLNKECNHKSVHRRKCLFFCFLKETWRRRTLNGNGSLTEKQIISSSGSLSLHICMQ